MKSKVVLYNARPTSNFYDKSIPLHLLAVASLLDKEGYEIKIIDASPTNERLDKVIEECKEAICLGVCCLTGFQIKGALDAAKLIKEKYGIPIIWGGWHPSITYKQVIQNEYADVVIRGQSERSFYEVVKCIEENRDLKGVDGISYKKNGKVIHNPDREFEDINNFPPLPYHLVNMEEYIHETSLGKRFVTYVSSVGCPHRCGFCAVNVIYKRKCSFFTAERVLDDLQNLVDRYKIDSVIFNDNNFFISEERTRKICQGIIDRKLNIRWGRAMGRTRQLLNYSDETWELMRDSGLYNILTGAESASQDVLDLIQKDTNVEDTLNFTKKCKKYRIYIEFSFMIGLPEPRFKDMNQKQIDKILFKEYKKIRKFIDKTRKIDKKNKFIISVYTAYPGSRLYNVNLELGFREPKRLEDWIHFTLNENQNSYVNPFFEKAADLFSNYTFLIWGNWDFAMKEKNIMKKLGYLFFYALATLRWKLNFVSLPVDYLAYKKLLNIILKERHERSKIENE
jgi:radical SAM superfamily enzyme YgiQ (UPF0313 family)